MENEILAQFMKGEQGNLKGERLVAFSLARADRTFVSRHQAIAAIIHANTASRKPCFLLTARSSQLTSLFNRKPIFSSQSGFLKE